MELEAQKRQLSELTREERKAKVQLKLISCVYSAQPYICLTLQRFGCLWEEHEEAVQLLAEQWLLTTEQETALAAHVRACALPDTLPGAVAAAHAAGRLGKYDTNKTAQRQRQVRMPKIKRTIFRGVETPTPSKNRPFDFPHHHTNF